MKNRLFIVLGLKSLVFGLYSFMEDMNFFVGAES